MILLIVSDNDHESCSLSQTVSTIFPNLVKNSHTLNNFPNDLLTASDDIHNFELWSKVEMKEILLSSLECFYISFKHSYNACEHLYILFEHLG